MATMMAKRFERELGRVIGTDADPSFWARNFGCSDACAASVIRELKQDGVAVERDGKLYRR